MNKNLTKYSSFQRSSYYINASEWRTFSSATVTPLWKKYSTMSKKRGSAEKRRQKREKKP